MDRRQILDAIGGCVLRDRAAVHGDAERSFERIAAYWSIHLGVPVTATDVAVMMALLKSARIAENPGHIDNWVDGGGYFVCGGEIATGRAEVQRVWIREDPPGAPEGHVRTE